MTFVDDISHDIWQYGRYGRRVRGAIGLYERRNDDIIHDNSLVSWLYDSPWSEQKFREFSFLYNLPGISNYLDYLLDYRSAQEYFRHTGLDWSNIHDPRKLSMSRSYGGMINFVSDNIRDLY